MLAAAVVHARAGRVRLKVPHLRDNSTLARQLEYSLLAQHDITAVSASSITGNLLIHYKSSVALPAILEMVDGARQIVIKPPVNVWWQQTRRQTLALLNTSLHGLADDEVRERQRHFGKNIQRVRSERNDVLLFARQFNSLPVMLLCASATLSLATGGLFDAALVGGVVLANATIGFFSERSAERLIESLITNEPISAVVRRNGQAMEVAAEEVVPGDVLLLAPGQSIVADARILESDGLAIDESLLTGESVPVNKYVTPLQDSDLPLADRRNMAFCGTRVTAGKGMAIVTATGFSTELGRITLAVAETDRQQAPLQDQIDYLGKQLTAASVFSAAALFGFGYLHGTPMLELISRSTALAVAAIPEGLPAVATSILATGLQAARRRNVLIRSLGAVETLGSVSVMCFDKTGTLTRNQMDVTAIVADNHRIFVGDHFTIDGHAIDPTHFAPLVELLRVAALCNESEINGQTLTGSSTETALLFAARQAGINIDALRHEHPLLHMERRSETRRYMRSVHHLNDDSQFIAIKGNPFDVLALCGSYFDEQGVHPLTEAHRSAVTRENAAMTTDGLRVLGFAFAHEHETASSAPVWLGLAGMSDPVRPGMALLIERFHTANIRTVMVTGDQVGTAMAVAREVNLSNEIKAHDCMVQHALPEDLSTVDVFARVSPLYKLEVVRALRDEGEVVAMIGDGTNDGPALRAADIGVTFGVNGTDAARTISDVVLGRDDLGTMVIAVEQGRSIYDNIRKGIHFLVGTNSSEVMLTVLASALGAGQPLNTVQLLWINLVTDVAIAFALGHEEPDASLMQQPPRSRAVPIVDVRDYRRLLSKAGLLTGSAFATHLYGMARYGAGSGGIGMMTLLASQLLDGFSSRSNVTRAWDLPSNPTLTRSIFGLFGLQILSALLPWGRSLLGIAALDLADLAVIAAGSIGPFLIYETLAKEPASEISSEIPVLAPPFGVAA